VLSDGKNNKTICFFRILSEKNALIRKQILRGPLLW
jgi:hypothetical protein